MEAKIYNQKGAEAGKIKLSEKIFGLPWNADLVHQVVTSMRSDARVNLAHTKTRGEVRGGGKKPWKQKGTGQARHGSTRSPIWVGGGVAHGPRNDTNYSRKVNKKMKTKALFMILSRKLKDGEILFVDSISFKAPKTKDAKAVLSALGGIKGYEKLATKRTNAALINILNKNVSVEKSFDNLKQVELDEVRNLNPLDILNFKFLIIEKPEESIKLMEAKMAVAK
ncbi:MAG: 50S ribosomal protein L4 [Minisyncoccia bacterium]